MRATAHRSRGARRRALPLIVCGLVACLLLPVGQASARKLGNSGTSTSFTATVTDGSIKVGSQTFDFDSGDVTISGSVNNTSGAISVPASGFHFPTFQVDSPLGTKNVHINVVETVTGTVNPLNSASPPNLLLNNLKVWIKIDDLGDCKIGSAGSPIVVSPLTVGTSGSVSGIPYNPASGTAKIVNGTFAVPGASGCSVAGFGVNGQVNDAVGIPSPSGNNNAQFSAQFGPILTKGVNASFVTSQPTATPPLSVGFEASGSTRTCTPNPCQYRWDWDNNGTVDQTTSTATATHQYPTPGTKTAKLTVADTDGDTDSTTRTFQVLHAPDLALDKTHQGSFFAGTNSTYTISVSNVGAGATQGPTAVTDTLPSGLTFVGATGSGWSCGAVGQAVTCTRAGTIGAGAAAPNITLTVAVAGGAASSVTNTASVATASVPPEPSTANNSDSDPTTVERIDLAISKSHDGAFRTGAVGTYHLQVSNSGTDPTGGATAVSDNLPAGLSFQGADTPAGWTCSAAGQSVSCSHGPGIPAGYSETIDLRVVASPVAVPGVTNTATISTSNDGNPANNSSSDPTTVDAAVDLAIEKSHQGSFRVGSNGIWTIAVRNRGARATAGTTTVTDTVPAGLAIASAAGAGWDCSVDGQDVSCESEDSLGANQSAAPIAVEVTVSEAAMPSVTNTATVATAGTGDDADVNLANDSASDPTEVAATDLAIDKSHVGGFPVNGQGTYTLGVRNDGGAATAGPTTVTDTLPAELSHVGAGGPGWSCEASGQEVTCVRAASIAAGATAPPISLTVAVAETEAESLINTAAVATADDVNPANDTDEDSTSITTTDLALAKSHGADFRVGAVRAYTLRARNVGSLPTVGETTVTDTLPAGLAYVAGTGSGWSCEAEGQDVTCARSAPIAAGSPAPPITLQVEVGADAYPDVTNEATVSNQNDRNDGNDSASDPTTVVAPDLAVIKSHQGSVQVNSRATYLLAVENFGTAATHSPATITDTLPAGMSFAGSPSSEWGCTSSGQQVTCEHPGAIPAGAAAQTLELHADVDPSVAAEVTNTAAVSVADDPVMANDGDEDFAEVGRIDLAIDKSHTGVLPRGGTGSYTIEVANHGSDPTAGPVRVTDALPVGLAYAGAAGPGWSCSVSAGTVECLHGTINAGAGAAPLTLEVLVASDAPAEIVNTASVATQGDADPGNDSDSDPAAVSSGRDAALTLRSATPAFRVGSTGSYLLTVRSAGAADLAGPVTVTATLPAGLSYVGSEPGSFSCGAAGQEVTCTDADGMPAGTRADIVLDVAVAKAAAPTAITSAQVSAPGDTVAANDTAADHTPVRMIDLAISMQRAGTFAPGASGSFTINVENVGTAATIGPATVTDTLPSGLSLTGASGSGWSCSAAGQLVTCTHAGALASGAQAEPLTISVTTASSAAGQLLANAATVATRDDAESANDTATDTVAIAGGAGGQLGVVSQPKKCKKGFKLKKGKCKKKKKRKKK